VPKATAYKQSQTFDDQEDATKNIKIKKNKQTPEVYLMDLCHSTIRKAGTIGEIPIYL
jgi:hypothetical protein